MESKMNVIIYSKDECDYCTKAIDLLKSTDLEYEEFKLNKHFSREELKEWFPDAKTFPVILLDKMWIGGYNELVEVVEEWKKED